MSVRRHWGSGVESTLERSGATGADRASSGEPLARCRASVSNPTKADQNNALPTGPELHAYYSETWFTAEGARLKLRRLQAAGLPDFRNWRFITLTMANHSGCPFAAYEKGKDRMRRFLARFRKAIGRPFKWCWKLEFHEDGFAHWHLLLEYTKRIPQPFLERDVQDWWGLGRVNVRRVKRRDIFYVFKYVAKGLDEVPEWVASHKGRLRVFQACRGFYTKRRARIAQHKDPASCLVRVDLVTRLGWERRRALLVTTNADGQRRVRAVKLRMTFSALLVTRAYESIRLRRQLAAPGVVNLSQLQALELQYEHSKYAGLAAIPTDAAAA